jgi:hypothetical protein
MNTCREHSHALDIAETMSVSVVIPLGLVESESKFTSKDRLGDREKDIQC